jgi:hypothetical protein
VQVRGVFMRPLHSKPFAHTHQLAVCRVLYPYCCCLFGPGLRVCYSVCGSQRLSEDSPDIGGGGALVRPAGVGWGEGALSPQAAALLGAVFGGVAGLDASVGSSVSLKTAYHHVRDWCTLRFQSS